MNKLFCAFGLLGLFTLLNSVAQAEKLEPPEFITPIQCEIPAECVVQNYMDVRPGPGVRDFNCGTLSYERHRGTDFRVLNYPSYKSGVPVLAAADGTVLRIKSGVNDGTFIKEGEKSIVQGREGGNEVVILHKNGWQTFYAHLRKGSIAVTEGDKVAAGDALGIVGLSGKSEFTHLHFHVMHNNKFYDPYLGTSSTGCQNKLSKSFWRAPDQEKLKYKATGLIETGFSSEIPNVVNLPFSSERERIALKKNGETLVFWIQAWGFKIADRLTLTYTDPTGKVSTNQITLKKNQASYFKYLGKKKPQTGWLSGSYTGKVRLERIVDGAWIIVFSRKTETTIP